jgi:non-heme chloroperoxidase
MAYAETRDGAKVYYKDWGAGNPVILIHGWPLSSDSWDPVSDALANAGHRVIAYDRRGFGRSEQTWDGYDYDSFADDLADVMKASGATENVTLVGFSMGGGEVARYMSRHNGKGVVRAALVASVVPYMLQTDDNPDGVPQETFDQMTQGMLEDRPGFMKTFLNDFFGVGWLKKPVSSEVLDWA